MEIKGLKENGQVKDKMKWQSWNIENSRKLAQARSLKKNSPKTRLSEFTPVKLGFFSSNSLKQAISRLSKQYLAEARCYLTQTQLG